jgi:hypothetical protein
MCNLCLPQRWFHAAGTQHAAVRRRPAVLGIRSTGCATAAAFLRRRPEHSVPALAHACATQQPAARLQKLLQQHTPHLCSGIIQPTAASQCGAGRWYLVCPAPKAWVLMSAICKTATMTRSTRTHDNWRIEASVGCVFNGTPRMVTACD